jgi:hypothetical protein
MELSPWGKVWLLENKTQWLEKKEAEDKARHHMGFCKSHN